MDAESSVLVDIMYRPQLLFPPSSENRAKAAGGGFISK